MVRVLWPKGLEISVRKLNVSRCNGLFEAMFKKSSFYVGDKDIDKIAAKNFGIKYLNVDNNSDLYNVLFSRKK